MIRELFTWVTNSLTASASIALLAAFIWGMLSVLLSPCHLSSIPLIVGYINGQEKLSTKRAFKLSLLFTLGMIISLFIIGVVTALLGRLIGDLGSWGNYLVAGVFFIMGLNFLEIISFDWDDNSSKVVKSKGYLGALLLGLVLGVALGPCTFAYLAPALGVVFNLSTSNLVYAIFLMGSYLVGYALVIVVAGTLVEWVQSYLDWVGESKFSRIVKRVCGVLLLLGVIYLIYTA
ncbi:cytochrome c-type biogenesis protein [Orenia metallireducens]|uniref:Cytochrome c-type biogenesis protein n=1 Tax=Orenia metallireducens TaxID=1413210 RepID=A0A285HHE8_9FIRM|nr:cytochrome c biogenesis protein CcdA [Orenia metallireducens]PRX27179.1 cytochrome c-type biogenesis protein [Orenia metallireducens]SNY35159.1 cytochrome c-type biogenesis protein [Orenia metallireducens]